MTIKITQAEYHELQEQRLKLTVVYPKFDDSKFIEWLRKKHNLTPFDSYTVEVS